mmetsp:Transcript_49220/g.140541  ORF Transcript_49220/g.140541 Transcript_49220/m.140541 type:complete len:220 (+) Transcript_49220:662-1321(+)
MRSPAAVHRALARDHRLQPLQERVGAHQLGLRMVPPVPVDHLLHNGLHHGAASLGREDGIPEVAERVERTHEGRPAVHQVREGQTELHVQVRVEAALDRDHRRPADVSLVGPHPLVAERGEQFRPVVAPDELGARRVVEEPHPQLGVQRQRAADVGQRPLGQIVESARLRRHHELLWYLVVRESAAVNGWARARRRRLWRRRGIMGSHGGRRHESRYGS